MVLQVLPDDASDMVNRLQKFFSTLIYGKGLVPTVMLVNGAYVIQMPNLDENSIPVQMFNDVLTENLQTEIEIEAQLGFEDQPALVRMLQIAYELAKAVNHALRSEKLLRWLEGSYEMHPHDPDAKKFKKPE